MRRRNGRAPRRAGFTLIELLVAISILAIVAVLGWRGLDGIIRARVALTADMEQLRSMQLAFAQLQSDCRQAVNPADYPNHPDHPAVVVQDGGVTLIRSVAFDHQPAQFEVVTYRFTDGKLTRQESASSRNLATLDQIWNAAMSGADTGVPVVLESGLAFMATRIMNDPPIGLEVVMTIKGHQNSVTKVFLVGAV